MQEYLFSEVSQWIPCKSIVNNDMVFSNLITDSRTVGIPEKAMFVAISGQNHNGHDYIPSLYQQGVRCFMVERDFDYATGLDGANFLVVENTLLAFQQLVAKKRNAYSCPVVGITGSNGKTVVKEWISQLIGNSKLIVRSPKSYNSQIGVPLSVWQMDAKTELGVFEAGISQRGEMEKIAPIISPSIGVLTNIGTAHQENFTSQLEKLKEKIKLFKNSSTIIFCSDSTFVKNEIQSEYANKKLFTWGRGDEASLQYLSKKAKGTETAIQLQYHAQQYEVFIPFSDDVSFENALTAISVLLVLGYDFEYISKSLRDLVPVAMRMELKEGINNCIVINDSYNSDLSSLVLSLAFLVQQSRDKTEKRTLILSDIYQSGIGNKKLCFQINELLKQVGVTKLVGVGNILKSHAHMFDLDGIFYDTTEELLQSLVPNSFKNEAILIKGSRNFGFEKVSSVLEMRHHQTSLEINLNALVDNLNYYRSKLNDKTKVLAMVKAFSYGSGSFEIANVLQHQKVDYLGVAFADEGVELRKSGISLPIVVMNPEAKSFPMMLEHQLEPELYGFKVFNQFVNLLAKEGISNYPVHIKLDTGMNRLGFVSSEIKQLTQVLKQTHEISVKSCFSHLVGSDDAQFDEFTQEQINRFSDLTTRLEKELGYSFIKHILNSAGILRFPQAQFNMVRLGIGMYGVGAIEQENLKPVTRFKSYISQIKSVKADETIGYNRKGVLAYDAEIAIVPVGYADGLNRKLGNGAGKMMVKGQLAAIVGNVCMDMCMIDVTGLLAKEGDEVEVFGPHNPVENIAQALDTIPYEVFTSISRRVKRVYYYE
ncbi:bifunctional UDP-N-acetylmuramoyl-tripeptide:D-alanyl-D-alanine ligase/alanine racemase [Saccharicrinis sp. 156]|uniref:bifunctional UDP-N-acetylmuramoyl-tripeptide:D-alanyl-D-alanine ligase/alanine racemase n=1 Tax=Saccharicrinis sp. 156 TaxID=3417574 RepID=UPI003D324DDD